MAYAALLSLSQTVDLILHYHQKSISPPAKDQIISIAENVNFLQVFLEDFPEEARRFEAVIRAVTLAAEDTVEFFMSGNIYQPRYASSVDSAGEQYENPSCSSSPLKDMTLEELISEARQREVSWDWHPAVKPDTKLKHKHLRYDFEELKEAKEEIESIAKKMSRMKNYITGANDVSDSAAPSSSSRVTPPQESVVVGFEEDVLNIKSVLCEQSSTLKVVPIVGMGGIGKTTLARNVYDDQLIMEHFDVRAWVTVSQDCSIEDIVSSFLASMKVLAGHANPKEKCLLLYQHLIGRRFLVVLDDMWSTNVWDDLQLMFPDDGQGSRIVLTTRLLDVASYAGSFNLIHQMHLLNEDHSWDLLQKMVFKHDPCPTKLEDIGRTIARRCRGLPLAIVVISGILSTIDQTRVAWNTIAEDVKSVIYTDEELVDMILSLSYVHLPRHLRPCFLYIAGFPEDYEMSVSKLIRLWIAEGYLKPSVSKIFEETGEEYLEDLLNRNLVLVTKRKTNGRIKRLMMHDLIKEMCMKKALHENFYRGGLHRESWKIPLCGGASIIRTRRYFYDIQKHSFLGYYRLLRILDLLHIHSFDLLPFEVWELFHLRYLAFNSCFKLPPGLSNLQNLQTFIISSTGFNNNLVHYALPFSFLLEIWSLPQLRHLHINFGIFFCLPPFQEGESVALENLQTLSVATNFVCTFQVVKAIPNLKKLEVLFTVRDDEDDYQLNNLVHFQQLENLKLSIFGDFPCPEKVRPDFPSTLKKLSLSGLRFPWEDLTVVGSLPNLQVLKLTRDAYIGDTWETTEGEFPQLRFLLIDSTDLEFWITESSHFPLLQRLALYDCPFLSQIPDDIGEIPTLERIDLDGTNTDLVESAKQIQENQEDWGNTAFQVYIVKPNQDV